MGQVAQQTAAAKNGGKTAVAAASTAELAQYLTFLLSGEMYAVGILNVKEIIEYGKLTEIPMMPAFIRGVIKLRGAAVPSSRQAPLPDRNPTSCIVLCGVWLAAQSLMLDVVRRVAKNSFGMEYVRRLNATAKGDS